MKIVVFIIIIVVALSKASRSGSGRYKMRWGNTDEEREQKVKEVIKNDLCSDPELNSWTADFSKAHMKKKSSKAHTGCREAAEALNSLPERYKVDKCETDWIGSAKCRAKPGEGYQCTVIPYKEELLFFDFLCYKRLDRQAKYLLRDCINPDILKEWENEDKTLQRTTSESSVDTQTSRKKKRRSGKLTLQELIKNRSSSKEPISD
nr:PREDICTED: uncharacterized protein LOC109032961 [Bemisia tabaci]